LGCPFFSIFSFIGAIVPSSAFSPGDAEQIVGRERRGRVSQVDLSGDD